MDSTLHLTTYNLKTIIPFGITCLGKTVSFGVSMILSESSAHITPCVKELGLDKSEKVVLMTDGAKCFDLISETFAFTHIRCVFHIKKQLDA